MKKITILFALLLVASVNIFASNPPKEMITNKFLHDKLIKIKIKDLMYIDANDDNIIDTTELLNTPYIYIDSLKDSDLSNLIEIKKFVNLESLEIWYSNFSTLNFDFMIENNPCVIKLGSNKINYVDLTKLTKLYRFTTSNDTIHILNTTNLDTLLFMEMYSPIDSIDVSTNTNLSWFFYQSVKPTKVNLYNNLNIHSILYKTIGAMDLTLPKTMYNLSDIYILADVSFLNLKEININKFNNLALYSNIRTVVCVNDSIQFKKNVITAYYVDLQGSLLSYSQNCSSTTAIENDLITEINKPIKSVTYYNLMGIEVTEPQNNIVYIKRTLYVDDTVLSEKIMLTE